MKYRNLHVEDMHCYGCAHAASSAAYPGHPSGETACMSCIRAGNHDGYNVGDRDNYMTMDSRSGECDLCDKNGGYRLFYRFCTECRREIENAKHLPV